jgi:hypothetical protein
VDHESNNNYEAPGHHGGCEHRTYMTVAGEGRARSLLEICKVASVPTRRSLEPRLEVPAVGEFRDSRLRQLPRRAIAVSEDEYAKSNPYM